MLTSVVVLIVDFCSRQAWLVIVTSLLVAIACSFYTARHFAINSDINALLSDDIGWRKRERTFEEAFGRFDRITVVVQAPTPELASTATAELAKALKERTDRFRSVNQPAGGEFFARNGLLFLPTDELTKISTGSSKRRRWSTTSPPTKACAASPARLATSCSASSLRRSN